MSVELPPEIHGEIISHILPDEETMIDRDCTAVLATLRLVSKSFYSSVTPSLFETYKVKSGNNPRASCNLFLQDLYKKDAGALALAPFVKHVVIEHLDVGRYMLRIYLQAIRDMPNIIKLSLSLTSIYPEHVEWLATLPALQNLSLSRCAFYGLEGSTLQTLTTVCRRSLKTYGPQCCNPRIDLVSRIVTSENIPLTTLDIDKQLQSTSFFNILESLPTIVNLTITRYVSRQGFLLVLSPDSLPNLRFVKCPLQMLPIFTGNHLESLRSLNLTGEFTILDSSSAPQPNETINPFSLISTSLQELTMSFDNFLSFMTESQTTFATNLPRLNTLIVDTEHCEFDPADSDSDSEHCPDDYIDRLIASFSPPNDVRELRFPVLGLTRGVNLLQEREMIAKIVKGPFPKLRKVAFSRHVTWVKDSVMRVVGAGESDTKDGCWRPFIPRWLIARISPSLDQSVVDKVSDYVQVRMEATSGFYNPYKVVCSPASYVGFLWFGGAELAPCF